MIAGLFYLQGATKTGLEKAGGGGGKTWLYCNVAELERKGMDLNL